MVNSSFVFAEFKNTIKKKLNLDEKTSALFMYSGKNLINECNHCIIYNFRRQIKIDLRLIQRPRRWISLLIIHRCRSLWFLINYIKKFKHLLFHLFFWEYPPLVLRMLSGLYVYLILYIINTFICIFTHHSFYIRLSPIIIIFNLIFKFSYRYYYILWLFFSYFYIMFI